MSKLLSDHPNRVCFHKVVITNAINRRMASMIANEREGRKDAKALRGEILSTTVNSLFVSLKNASNDAVSKRAYRKIVPYTSSRDTPVCSKRTINREDRPAMSAELEMINPRH